MSPSKTEVDQERRISSLSIGQIQSDPRLVSTESALTGRLPGSHQPTLVRDFLILAFKDDTNMANATRARRITA